MNLSAILVLVDPERFATCIDRLNDLQGVDVYHTDPHTGRVIVVQEADSVSAEVDGLRRLQSQPFVRLAELVNHYFEDDPEMQAAAGRSAPSAVEAPAGRGHSGDRSP